MKPIRFKAELILNTETHTTGSGPIELAAQVVARGEDREKTSASINALSALLSQVSDTPFGKWLCKVDELRMAIEVANKPTVALLPRFYKPGEEPEIYITGSSIRGVLRAALDKKALENAVARLEKVGPVEPPNAKDLCGELDDPARLLFVDRLSHAAIHHTCTELYTLQYADKRKDLVNRVAQSLGVSTGDFVYREDLALGLSELLFGVTGLRSSIYVSNFYPSDCVETYVKTFNAVARSTTARPFYVELLPPRTKFEGYVEFRPTPFVTEKDLEEMLCAVAEKTAEGWKIPIQIGKRKKLGWGQATLYLRHYD
ncbi:MAG: RAMP superfamily CRISPR-associated protein [Pyrobaculum sp.]|jgi:CRISPR/Cas system CSM-associated protein Csm3 (group 7 of RAMP superfamily)